jgi:peptidoglycan/LPS O-acetylase OafA/YrhL
MKSREENFYAFDARPSAKPSASHSEQVSVRFDFAHILRGIAALLVLVSHFAGVFWDYNPDIMDLIGTPRIAALPQLDVVISSLAKVKLILGQFGVGTFFVLSGFVISFSIMRESRKTFLIRRTMRIYPTYILGFLLMMAALWIASQLTERPFKYTADHLAIHTLILLRGIVGYARIDGISWTLEIELVFYVFMVALGTRLMRTGMRALVLGVLIILAVSLPLIVLKTHGFVGLQVSCGLMLASGIAYAMHANGQIASEALWTFQILLAAILSVVWGLISSLLGISVQWVFGYLLGMAVFAVCYRFCRTRRIDSRVLNHLADISYPLYVVHGLLGYAVMYWVVTRTGSVYGSIAAAFFVSYALAYGLHRLAEQPCIVLSRRWTAVKRA